jgi:hypothetical protein
MVNLLPWTQIRRLVSSFTTSDSSACRSAKRFLRRQRVRFDPCRASSIKLDFSGPLWSDALSKQGQVADPGERLVALSAFVECAQDVFGPANHGGRKAREFRDMNAV